MNLVFLRLRARRLLGSVAFAWIVLSVVGAAWSALPARGASDPAARVAELYADYRTRSLGSVAELAPARARAFADSLDAIWLDVRSERERRVSIIEGAVDRATYERHRDEWAARPVIVYCTIGYRSGLATRELRNRGIVAFNLAGGVLAWIHEGGALVDGRTGESTHRVHVYGWRWNLVPDGWQGVW